MAQERFPPPPCWNEHVYQSIHGTSTSKDAAEAGNVCPGSLFHYRYGTWRCSRLEKKKIRRIQAARHLVAGELCWTYAGASRCTSRPWLLAYASLWEIPRTALGAARSGKRCSKRCEIMLLIDHQWHSFFDTRDNLSDESPEYLQAAVCKRTSFGFQARRPGDHYVFSNFLFAITA